MINCYKFIAFISIVLMIFVSNLFASEVKLEQNKISLREIEIMALNSDQQIKQLQQQQNVYRNKAISSDTLPDPKITLAAKNLPTDSFDVSQENMTQLAIGLKQVIPGGNKLDLKSHINSIISNQFEDRIALRKRQLLKTVRFLWFEIVALNQTQHLLKEKKTIFTNLKSVTESLFTVGKKDQQDVFKSQVELEKVNDKLMANQQKIAVALAKLKRWTPKIILDSALIKHYPKWGNEQHLVKWRTLLLEHPILSVSEKNIEAKREAVKLAQQSYKPDWSLGLSYGQRSGNNFNGFPRSDFLSIDFSMNLPLFTANRQDKQVLASQNALNGAHWSKLNNLENLRAELESSNENYIKFEKRIHFFESNLVPISIEHSKSAMNAYQRDAADFNDPMQAYNNEINLKIELIQLTKNKYLQLTMIRFLVGENL